MRFATFNLENLFARPKVFKLETWSTLAISRRPLAFSGSRKPLQTAPQFVRCECRARSGPCSGWEDGGRYPSVRPPSASNPRHSRFYQRGHALVYAARAQAPTAARR